MKGKYLSSLCRGTGHKGEAYEDNKARFPQEIPYTLKDIGINDGTTEKPNKLSMPGTYTTESGQLMLYTRENKTIDIASRTSRLLPNVADVYNTVDSVAKELKTTNGKCERLKLNIGDRESAYASVHTNTFFPQKWKSPAKEFMPKEMYQSKKSLPDFLKSKSHAESAELMSGNNSGSFIMNKPFLSYRLLPDIQETNHVIASQRQNNAANTTPKEDKDDNRTVSLHLSDSSSSEDNIFVYIKKSTGAPLEEVPRTSIVDPNDTYDTIDELIIPINQKPNPQGRFDMFSDIKNSSKWKITLSDAIGEELLTNDKKLMMKPTKPIQPEQLTIRLKDTEAKRIKLLNELYGSVKVISNIHKSILMFADILLHQFQEYNSKRRKERIEIKQEDVHNTIKDLRNQNEEISERLKTASTSLLKKNKSTLDHYSFAKEKEALKHDLRFKSDWENGRLKTRLLKLISTEEEDLNNKEFEILKLEQAAIKESFRILQAELIKSNERRQETENLILRLEMKRESVNKIEKDIEKITPLSLDLNKLNLTDFIKDMNAEVVVSWKRLMNEYAKDFRIDDKSIYDLMIKISAIERSIQEKGSHHAVAGKCVKKTENKSNVLKLRNSPSAKPSDSKKPTNALKINRQLSSSSSSVVCKADLEHIKLNQKIATDCAFTYFVPWPTETYEAFSVKSDVIHTSSSESEDDSGSHTNRTKRYQIKKRSNSTGAQTDTVCRLDYKKILRYNPLEHKNKTKNKKDNSKTSSSNS